ncbi:MAG: aminoglycoside 3'-phosphotransferase [Clostridiales bacterium]|jgi:kanamycin kinase|nr:aminoglycoside 3'-phosphotransferase [Clostridiales bacterium]
MTVTEVAIDIDEYPAELRPLLTGAKLYDSSCSPEARVIFIDKDAGYFLKIGRAADLNREYELTRYFHDKGLAAKAVDYRSDSERGYLITQKLPGGDCIAAKYLEQPIRLAELLGERLALLHSLDCSGCPVQNHTETYLAKAKRNYAADTFDRSHFPDSFGYLSAEEAWGVVEKQGHLLRTDTLLHGDYCLPNIMLDDWRFSGFIDLDSGGVGDRHVDIFWGVWSLRFNLKTDIYRERFIDAYGRGTVDEEMLRVVAAAEVFG